MTTVLAGLDVLARRQPRLLRGRRVGLLAHEPSVTRELRHAVDVVRALPGTRLAALFAPEHGITGAAQDQIGIGGERHRATGLPVWSLYGRRLAPTQASLRGLGALVVDLQDVGSRYYTYVWTMTLAMRECARAGVPVVVLDRPNPLGGEHLEGNIAASGYSSFVGLLPLPTRHGMTIAELAGYLNETHGLGCDLTVVPMQGWRRRMLWEDTGLPWVAPSPNMPTLDTARVYPGGCLIEGTNLSEGRGTTRPFEWVGAPYLDGARLAAALERRARFRPYLTYLALIAEARRQAGRRFRWRRPPYEFEWKRLAIDLLAGGPEIRRHLESGRPLARLTASWTGDLARFARARRPYLLYS